MIFVGDIYQNPMALRNALVNANGSDIVCLGDLGMGIDADLDREYLDLFETNNNLYTIRGNRDNPSVISGLKGFIPDGTIMQTNYGPIMFVGGAHTRNRYSGMWYPDEEVSQVKSYDIQSIAGNVRPTILVSHDGPDFIVKKMVPDFKTSRTTSLLGSLFSFCEPTLSIFGHYYSAMKTRNNECDFVSVEQDGYHVVPDLKFILDPQVDLENGNLYYEANTGVMRPA